MKNVSEAQFSLHRNVHVVRMPCQGNWSKKTNGTFLYGLLWPWWYNTIMACTCLSKIVLQKITTPTPSLTLAWDEGDGKPAQWHITYVCFKSPVHWAKAIWSMDHSGTEILTGFSGRMGALHISSYYPKSISKLKKMTICACFKESVCSSDPAEDVHSGEYW